MTPFDALKNVHAEMFVNGYKAIRELEPDATGLSFHGRWERRRFAICDIQKITAPITDKVHDFGESKLSLPHPSDPKHLVADLRSFGMAYAARAKSPPWFESALGSDGVVHSIAHHHHVARCGYRDRWPEGDFVGETSTLPKCKACAKTAAQAKKKSMSK